MHIVYLAVDSKKRQQGIRVTRQGKEGSQLKKWFMEQITAVGNWGTNPTGELLKNSTALRSFWDHSSLTMD